jgi:hypothetical protein
MPATARRRAYDHWLRDLVHDERGPGLFRHLGVDRSADPRVLQMREGMSGMS